MGVTIETLLLEVARAVEPLRRRLVAGEIELLFGELGLPAPDVVLAVPGVTTSLSQAGTAAGELPQVISDLAAAIEAGDDSGTLEVVVRAMPIVQSVVSAIEAVGTAVQAAANAAGAAKTEVEAFASELPERLMGYLVATYLATSHPVLGGVGQLLGILEMAPQPATADAPGLRPSQPAPRPRRPAAAGPGPRAGRRVPVGDPRLLAGTACSPGWRRSPAECPASCSCSPASRAIRRCCASDWSTSAPPTTPRRACGPGCGPRSPRPSTPPSRCRLASGSRSRWRRPSRAARPIEVLPPAELQIVPPTAEVSGQARIGIAVEGTDGDKVTLLGIAGGTRLEAGKLRASAGADLAWNLPERRAVGDFVIEVAIEDGHLEISMAGADGFLSAILGELALGLDFDLLAGWSATKGLYFDGGAALAIDIPVDLDLGPIRIQMLHLALGLEGEALTLEASGAISAKLGPFAMAVDRMGTKARLSFPSTGGNLGPADLAFEFKPPSGIGLSLDAGVVKGGGYLFIDVDAGQYAGVLELAFGPVSIKAIGILSTKLPGGADGWALLLLVFGEFPAVQLGFGFTLNAVGGIIGLQHGVSIDVLQSGLRTGVLDSVLFPNDPVANAPTLIQQLRIVFPIVPRALTLGPALKLGWSTPALVTLKLGLVLQFDDVLGAGPGQPSLSRIVLVGQLKVQIPPVDELGIDAPALVQLQVDVVGAYDVNEKALSIDAVLRDSHVAMLPITGSLVVRARFGTDPTFLLAVGGFHPRFTDLPPGIPPQDRVGISLQYGIATIRIVGYFAVTSNTVQTGAEASLVAAGGGFRVEAYVGFDALFVFDPVFHFEIDFRVGASIRYKSISLASVRLEGRLSGPGRWEVTGSATISLLFFDVSIDFEVGWGDAPAPALPSAPVGSQIAAALSKAEAWTAQLPTGGAALVSLRGVDGGADVLAHPLGEVAGIQKIVPLGIRVDRVGRTKPSDGDTFTITAVEIGGQAQTITLRDEHFARGEYLDLSEEEKLSKPSFERFPAGVVAATADFEVPTTQIAFEPEWETVFLGEPRPSERLVLDATMLVAHAAFGAVARSELRTTERLVPEVAVKVSVAEPAFTVTTVAAPGVAIDGAPAATFTQATQHAAAAGRRVLVTDLAEILAAP